MVPYELPIELGRTELPHLGIALDVSIEQWNGTQEPPKKGGLVEVADADRVHFPLQARSRREGDRFRPLGMRKEKRLKDFLIDERVPFYDRNSLPLLCDQDQIVWVVGVRLSDAVRITRKTKRALVMRLEELAW